MKSSNASASRAARLRAPDLMAPQQRGRRNGRFAVNEYGAMASQR